MCYPGPVQISAAHRKGAPVMTDMASYLSFFGSLRRRIERER